MLHMTRKGSCSRFSWITAGMLVCSLAASISLAAPPTNKTRWWGAEFDMQSDMPSDLAYDMAVDDMLKQMLQRFSAREPDKIYCHILYAEDDSCHGGALVEGAAGDLEPPQLTHDIRKAIGNLLPAEIRGMFTFDELVSHAVWNGRFYVVRQYTGAARQRCSPQGNGCSVSDIEESATFKDISANKHCDCRQGLDHDDVERLVTSVYKQHARNLRYPMMRLPGVAGSFTVMVRPSEQFPGKMDLDYCTQQLDVEQE
ncbi:MAG: hypothetical protein OXC07_00685 [Kistimonas sp.]|nr:hypothetical protein [Kistimonas sp.]